MGGGSKQQHLLFTLAFPEPAALIADVRKAHPNIKVTYLRQEPDHPFSEENKLPDGKHFLLPFFQTRKIN